MTGSSCSGKSVLARGVGQLLDNVRVFDFDEVGVPENPSVCWRNRTLEQWLKRALEHQAGGVDVLLACQSPLGEILAAPSAPRLDGLAVCLLDVADDVRRERLEARDGGRWSPADVDAFLGWADWHRRHARDPRYRPEAISDRSWSEMAWHRWADWNAADPRWSTDLIDTTSKTEAESIDELTGWIIRSRSR